MEPTVVSENGKYHLVYGTGVEPFGLYLIDLKWDSDDWPYPANFSSTTQSQPASELPMSCPVCKCRPNPTVSCGDLQEKDEVVSKKYIFNFYDSPVNVYYNNND